MGILILAALFIVVYSGIFLAEKFLSEEPLKVEPSSWHHHCDVCGAWRVVEWLPYKKDYGWVCSFCKDKNENI